MNLKEKILAHTFFDREKKWLRLAFYINMAVIAGFLIALFNVADAHTPCDNDDCYYQWQCDSQGQCEDL